MHQFAVLNGETVAASDAALPIFSSAGLYGKGVFTTVAIVASEPLAWHSHAKRLAMHAHAVGIDLAGITMSRLEGELRSLIASNAVVNGRARITVFDCGDPLVWSMGEQRRVLTAIITGDMRHAKGGLRLSISPFPINSGSPLAGIKSCNYLDAIIAQREAVDRGFDEAVRLNARQHVVSGTMSNIFWSVGERLYTPALSTGCVDGTTRGMILDRFKCEEVEVGVEALLRADSIYVTSAGLGIRPVAFFADRELPGNYDNICKIWPLHDLR